MAELEGEDDLLLRALDLVRSVEALGSVEQAAHDAVSPFTSTGEADVAARALAAQRLEEACAELLGLGRDRAQVADVVLERAILARVQATAEGDHDQDQDQDRADGQHRLAGADLLPRRRLPGVAAATDRGGRGSLGATRPLRHFVLVVEEVAHGRSPIGLGGPFAGNRIPLRQDRLPGAANFHPGGRGRAHTGTVHGRRADRRRRARHSPPRLGRAALPLGRRQGRRGRVGRAGHARGPRRRPAQPPGHRHALRARPPGRLRVPGHRAGPGPEPAPPRRPRAALRPRGGRARGRALRRALPRPRGRRRPPRRQAGQRPRPPAQGRFAAATASGRSSPTSGSRASPTARR